MTEETKRQEEQEVEEQETTASEQVVEEVEAADVAAEEEVSAVEETAEVAEVTSEVETTEVSGASDEASLSQEEAMADIATFKRGDQVKGKIVKVEDNQAIVSIGYKYDGIIPIRELSPIHLEKAEDAVQVGDEVECQIVSIDDEKEKLLLSKRAIDAARAWDELEKQFESQEIIEVVVADVVKGGLVVDLGVRGFIPASMVERHYVDDFSDYKGRTIQVKIKEFERENNKLILSRKDVLDEEYEANKQQILASLQADQVLDGTVQRLTPFGVFVDIGGIDGLVHISELSWTHVNEASEVVNEGDQVQVKVLKVDPESERISLSMKAVQPGPWDTVADKFEIGQIVEGEVKRLVNFGAFVEISAGVEGLVHISQIAHRHIGTPHEVLEEGQVVSVKILDINPTDKRVSLSIKETEEAPEAAQRPDKGNEMEAAPPNQSLNLTLGERFGDALNKFK